MRRLNTGDKYNIPFNYYHIYKNQKNAICNYYRMTRFNLDCQLLVEPSISN